ncbi:alpha/beta hydrolase [Pseudonocardia endophytica]|uniref:S-formylglutathione hydrolase FrmB n=1 Tax=Pseudonocardia endophytica TaxID=401976 RepID=A0A4R1HIR5_PSEEN|nr:alpha/beta hydrolase-fold protein [Pseudonocardia endophytica]TCK21708.1 S-formylglutathione hydrolase FrmB [Pseudonocardia endophytica]
MTPDISVVPIADWWPVGPVLLVLLGLAVLWFHRGSRRLVRGAARSVIVLLVVLQIGSIVNAHFEFYRTIGQAFGEPPADVVSLAEAREEEGRVPDAGQIVSLDVPATASRFSARPTQVYLPPSWFAKDRPLLPVVMLLHGTPGSPQDWIDGGQAQTTADAFARAHGGLAPVLVLPDVNGSLGADTECVDSPLGNVETYLTVDVPTAAVRVLGTRDPGPSWAVAGLSEGGSCALMLALRHPDRFGAFGDFSGLLGPRLGDTNADTASTVAQLFGGSQQAFAAHEPIDLLTAGRYPGLGGWFEVGDADQQPYAAIEQLVPAARSAGITSCLVVLPGAGHTFDVWSDAFSRSLPWLSGRAGLFGRNAPSASCPQG